MKRAGTSLVAVILFGTASIGRADLGQGKHAYDRGNYLKAMQEWKPLAENGNPAAQLEVGLLYWFGQGVRRDRTEAGNWLRKAAQAFDIWQSKADAGEVSSQLRLGLLYWLGQGVPKDPAKALGWLIKAAQGGSADAQGWLSSVYLEGDIVSRDQSEAMKWLQRSAENGSIEAQAYLGDRYLRGAGVSRDPTTAIRLLKGSADQGNLFAMEALGRAYMGDFGIPQSYGEALKYFRKGAEQGHVRSMVGLAVMYYRGNGVKQDYSTALKWFRMAADRSNGRAQIWIGVMYSKGQGVRQDNREAVRWYRMAAEQGESSAQFALGQLYESGEGVPQDYKAAFRYYEAAANKGAPLAQTAVGRMYAEGKGVTQDFVLAYMWLNLGALERRENEAKTAREWRDNVARNMTPEQILQAQELSRKWTPHGVPNNELALVENERHTPTTAVELTGTGSGFVVNSGGYVLTNYHVVEGCVEVRIPEASGTSVLVVTGADPQNDLALLRLPTPGASAAVFANDGPKPGQEVIAVGYPLRGLLASSVNITTGIVSALAGIRNDARMIQTTAPVQPGNSGGPLLDQSGNVLGVISSKLDALKVAQAIGDIPQNINFAIKASVARGFLDASGVEYRTATSAAKLDSTVIAEQARKFTFVVECWK